MEQKIYDLALYAAKREAPADFSYQNVEDALRLILTVAQMTGDVEPS